MRLHFATFSTAREAVFFKSFTGYRIPPKLESPVTFEETKNLASFYIGRYDSQERLRWFVKVLAEKQADCPFLLDKQQPAGTLLFFEAARGEQPEPTGMLLGYESACRGGLDLVEFGPLIDYGATRDKDQYFAGRVSPSGRDGSADLLCRNLFADIYTYWPNGRLKRRKFVRSDGSASLWLYDQRGTIVERSEEPAGFCTADLWEDDGPSEAIPNEWDGKSVLPR